jgi:hypothetical protein
VISYERFGAAEGRCRQPAFRGFASLREILFLA